MGYLFGLLFMATIPVLSGCSSEAVKRAAYETMQNAREQECLKNPAMDCGKRGNYEDYQRQRKELEQSR
ncbi:MAG: hypothetical protein LJE57_11110 [Gallionella sp.]|nr:hypothetical protein [Gallionella sp.]